MTVTHKTQSPLPLTGLRVIDLTNVIAGPVATRALGQLGAQVIKVEQPWGRSVGNIALYSEDSRQSRPYNMNAGFNEVNRAKLSISINLADAGGKNLFESLVGISDVVIENYSPRVMGNLGIDYESLRQIRPDLIMVSMPALGEPGPWSNHISFGPGTEGLGGLCDVTGYEGGPPHKPGNFYSDQTSAFHVATAIMAANWKRRRTGKGKHIKIVLRDVTMAVIGESFLEYQLTGRPPKRIGNRHPSMAPHNVYRCKGDDSWVVIAVASDEEWGRFREAIGNPDWSQSDQFATTEGRLLHQDELDDLIQEWTKGLTPQEAMQRLQSCGVKAGAVLKAPEILEDPHYSARGFIDVTEHPDGGAYRHPGLSWKFSSAPTALGQRAPMFAEHSDWVLKDLLSVPQNDVDDLQKEAIVPLVPVARG